ncbi:lycopene cyclase [Christiangramia fulva]|uniref:Lycopene cyclase n=1 Tax=Christiangramia fulva TaxID=2126553 RepID=A0A2R3Z0Z1_9FLAO|nr:lycopene cyclase family protein [Christiangramia fulva]AVR43929.1 lycopene cyclase [Christiangramia fulva]
MIVPDYYYVIVGGGLAGLQLALSINEDIFFKGKKIAIIEPSLKDHNDKTWCFWEKGEGKWDEITTKSWKKGKFITKQQENLLDLGDYSYKMLRAIDFYEYAKQKLEKSTDIFFIQDKIQSIDPVTRTAIGAKKKYTAKHFFDSRPGKKYQDDPKNTVIYQHFKGWRIKTSAPAFDPEVFTMMDYRIKYKNTTSFTYILPFSETEALLEFTFFTPFMTEEAVYDEKLKEYLEQILKIKDWEVLETEKGMIPMTDFNFEKNSSKHITMIGTAGGWVKASSGYSFKNTEKKVAAIIENIKMGKPPGQGLSSIRFRKYDGIFLDVLARHNELGEKIFEKLYTRNKVQEIFRFLDEETKPSEELKIMLSLYHPQFLKSFFRKI